MSISSVPVGQPLHGATSGQSVKRFFTGCVTFSGRASRSEFWWAMLFTGLLSFVVQIPFWIVWSITIVHATAAGATEDPSRRSGLLPLFAVMLLLLAVVGVFSLAVALPTYAVMWRRLQDAGFHGAFALLSLVALGIVPLIMSVLPSSPQGVRFDPAHLAHAAASGYDPDAQPAYGQSQQYPPPSQHGPQQ